MMSRFPTNAALAGACILTSLLWAAQNVFAADSGKRGEYAVTYQINPAHSGYINFGAGFSTPLTQIWSVNLDTALSYPVIAENKVFVNSSNAGGETYALDLATGTTMWSKFTGAMQGPAYDHTRLFLANSRAVLSALSAQSGKSLWATKLPYQYYSTTAPMAYNGQVFTAATENGGDLYAVDEKTGTVEWYESVQGGDESIPAYGEDGIYVSYSCQYYKFNPDGTLDWNDNMCGAGTGTTPVYYNKRLYVEDPSRGNVIVSATTGESIGTFVANIGDPPAFWRLSDGKRLGFSLYNGYLYGWRVWNLANVWSFAGDNQLSTPPIVINGLVVEGSSSGNVYVLDASTGTQEWSANTGAAVTALGAGQGTLIVISGSIVTAFVPQ